MLSRVYLTHKHFFSLSCFFLLLLLSLLQQVVEDLLEDEDEEFDKDDKVIMSHVWDAHTYTHILPQEGLTLFHRPKTD